MKILDTKVSEELIEQFAQSGKLPAGKDLSQLIDKEMELFKVWFSRNLNSSLTNFELAAVKTYLYHKLLGRIDSLNDDKESDTLNTARMI